MGQHALTIVVCLVYSSLIALIPLRAVIRLPQLFQYRPHSVNPSLPLPLPCRRICITLLPPIIIPPNTRKNQILTSMPQSNAPRASPTCSALRRIPKLSPRSVHFDTLLAEKSLYFILSLDPFLPYTCCDTTNSNLKVYQSPRSVAPLLMFFVLVSDSLVSCIRLLHPLAYWSSAFALAVNDSTHVYSDIRIDLLLFHTYLCRSNTHSLGISDIGQSGAAALSIVTALLHIAGIRNYKSSSSLPSSTSSPATCVFSLEARASRSASSVSSVSDTAFGYESGAKRI